MLPTFCILFGIIGNKQDHIYPLGKSKKNMVNILFISALLAIFSYKNISPLSPFAGGRFAAKGFYCTKINDLPEAGRLFNKALAVFPDDKLPYLGKAAINLMEDDLARTQNNLGKALLHDIRKTSESSRSFYEGQAALSKNDEDKARSSFYNVLRLRLLQYGIFLKEIDNSPS